MHTLSSISKNLSWLTALKKCLKMQSSYLHSHPSPFATQLKAPYAVLKPPVVVAANAKAPAAVPSLKPGAADVPVQKGLLGF